MASNYIFRCTNEEKDAMNDKEKVDCLLGLNKAKLDHFMQTRAIEFQVNIAIWTLIVVGGSYLYEKIYISNIVGYIIVAFIIFIIFIFHVVWMILIQNSQSLDHDYMNEYRRIIDELTGISVNEPQPRESFKFIIGQLKKFNLTGWHWIILETAMTFLLLLGVGILLSLPKDVQIQKVQGTPSLIQSAHN